MTRHSYRITLAALLLLCCALYALGLDGPFLFDSKVALLKNPDFHLDPAEFTQWWLATVSSGSGPTGRPVSMLGFALNFAIGGADSALGFKLGNLLVHCLAGFLAARVLLVLLREAPALKLSPPVARAVALTAAGLWLLHPLQVSTVLYAVQRMEQLSALFTLLGILAFLHFRIRWLERAATTAEVSNCLLAVGLCLMLAVFSKEDGILLLPLLVLIESVLLRSTWAGCERRGVQLFCAAGMLGGTLLLLGLALLQPAWLQALYDVRDFDLSERLLTQGRVLWQYLGWILLPDIRGMGLHHDNVLISQSLFQPVTTLFALLGWMLLVVLAFLGWRRWPVLSFTIGWYLSLHLLESTLLPLEMVYEHRNYLPMLGICLMLSCGLWVLLPIPGPRQRLALSAVLLLLFAVQLGQRTSLWGDEEAMVTYHLRHHPDSLRAVYHYANTQLRKGEASSDAAERQERLQRSRRYYLHMLQLDEDDLTAVVTLLYLDDRYFGSLESGRWRDRLMLLAEKPVLSPADGNALDFLLRCVLASRCKMPQEQFEKLMLHLSQRFPGNPVYLDFLARHAGELQQDYVRAIQWHESALLRSPDYLPAYTGLVKWYGLAEQQGKAIETARELLRRDQSIIPLRRVLPMLELPES